MPDELLSDLPVKGDIERAIDGVSPLEEPAVLREVNLRPQVEDGVGGCPAYNPWRCPWCDGSL